MTKNLSDIIFFDIETIPLLLNFEELPENLQIGWTKICQRNPDLKSKLADGARIEDVYWEMSSLFSDFSRCFCVSFGKITDKGNQIATLKIHENSDAGERDLIEKVCRFFTKTGGVPGGYNIKGFDLPYIFKKAIKYGIQPDLVPPAFKVFEKKPWEVKMFDLCDLWKMTGFQTQMLSTVCDFLEVKQPKEELEGKYVKNLYYNDYRFGYSGVETKILDWKSASQEEREHQIVVYCEADVESNLEIAKKIAPYF